MTETAGIPMRHTMIILQILGLVGFLSGGLLLNALHGDTFNRGSSQPLAITGSLG